MQLIGMLDSPYVRRVAISARFLGLEYEHRPLSIFRGYDEFRGINPMVKVPTLVCDDGSMLVDSTLIIDYLEALSGTSLMPQDTQRRQAVLSSIGIAMVAMEKVVQLIYETKQRPQEKQHEPWLERLRQQLSSALDAMEQSVGNGSQWLSGEVLTQGDITTAVSWRFVQHVFPTFFISESYPGLTAYSDRAEALAEFVACPIE
jgi:glutathione S-transferase